MTPVAAFAAVVAMAGPQRLAAESSMEETAGDLAAFSVALRDGRDVSVGEIEGFLPDCEKLPSTAPAGLDQTRWTNQANDLQEVCELLLGNAAGTDGGYWHQDLGYWGVDANSWEGFYSDTIKPSPTCVISANLETRNAVYAALAADWQHAGWAAAQVWPDGVRLGSEQVARLNNKHTPPAPPATPLAVCKDVEFAPPPGSEPARTAFAN